MTTVAETQRIKRAKWIDEYVGRCLIVFLQWFRPMAKQKSATLDVRHILFIKFWGIGSIILTEPALRDLRLQFPRARLHFLTLAQNRELFALIPDVHQVYTVDFKHLGRLLLTACRLIPRLRAFKYDLIFDGEFFANCSALFSRLLKPHRLIGFSRIDSSKTCLLDTVVQFDDHRHAAVNFCRLVNLRDDIEAGSLETNTVPRVELPLSGRKLRHWRPQSLVVMNINASPLALERRLPREHFVHLAKWLLQRYDIELAMIGTADEKEYTDAATQAIGSDGRVHNLAGALGVSELAELISASALLVSNDSGPLHLAAALEKPVVGFFGPETPERFGPLCEKRLIFYLGLPCSPCMSVDNAKTVDCTNHRRCMLDFSVGMVIKSVQEFIDKNDLIPKQPVRHETLLEVRL